MGLVVVGVCFALGIWLIAYSRRAYVEDPAGTVFLGAFVCGLGVYAASILAYNAGYADCAEWVSETRFDVDPGLVTPPRNIPADLQEGK